jgi:hypothetical protein
MHGLGGAGVVALQVLAAVGAGLQQVLLALQRPFHAGTPALEHCLARQTQFHEAAGAGALHRFQAHRHLDVAQAHAAVILAEQGLGLEPVEHVQPQLGLEVVVHHGVVDAFLLDGGAEFLAAEVGAVFQAVVAGEVVVVVGVVAGQTQLGAVTEGVLGRPVFDRGGCIGSGGDDGGSHREDK